MPAISHARVEANRRNALKSTGPKTPEGKDRSRRNGLKHGLTGSGAVVPEGDAPEVEARASALMAEMAPATALGQILVGQLATLSVRMERGARREEAAVATRVRHSGEDFDRERVERAALLFEGIAADPRGVVAELRRTPEGVDRMLLAWADLRADLTRAHRPGWFNRHHDLAVHLFGLDASQARGSRFDVLSDAAMCGGTDPGHPDWESMDYEARKAWARARLVEAIDAEVAKLAEHRETLDLESIELDRIDAADLALFDPSREAALARRYEAEARRGFFKALVEFRKVEAEAEAEATEQAAPGPEEVEIPGALASSREASSPVVREPRPGPPGGADRPNLPPDGAARGVDGRAPTAGRAVVAP